MIVVSQFTIQLTQTVIYFQDDYEEERTTNLTAVVAALQMWNGEDVVSIARVAFIT